MFGSLPHKEHISLLLLPPGHFGGRSRQDPIDPVLSFEPFYPATGRLMPSGSYADMLKSVMVSLLLMIANL